MRVLRFPRRTRPLRRFIEGARDAYLVLVASLTILCVVNVLLLLALQGVGL